MVPPVIKRFDGLYVVSRRDCNRGILQKGVHFIQKPFSIDDLVRRIEEILTSA